MCVFVDKEDLSLTVGGLNKKKTKEQKKRPHLNVYLANEREKAGALDDT